MKEHLFTHTGVKPYECHLCEEKFSFTDTLAKHIETIHKCRVCDFEATTKSRLKVHVQSKHGGIRFDCTQCDVFCPERVDLAKPLLVGRGI